MAGFDFFVPSSNEERPFVRSLLHLTQHLSAIQGLQLRYRWEGESGYQITVDGALADMQANLEVLIIGLFSHAIARTDYSALQARKSIARRISRAYSEELDEATSVVEEISEIFGGTPDSYSFTLGSATHLAGHLNAFTISLTLFHRGMLRAHQIAEESHTIIELLLRNVLGPDAKKLSFEGMVNRAVEDGILSSDIADPLLELKNLRRDAKHKGQGIQRSTMDLLFPSIIKAIHRLTRVLRAMEDND